MMVVTAATCTASVSLYQYHIADMAAGGLLDVVFMINFIKIHMFAVNFDNGSKLDDPIAGKDLTER
jgi:hypothetical protein